MKAEFLLAIRRLVRRRKMLIFIVIALALASSNVIVTDGYITNMNRVLYETVVQYSVGDIVIRPLKNEIYLEDVSDTLRTADQLPGIESISKRIESFGTAENKGKFSEAALWAFVPSRESATTRLNEKVSRGTFLEDNDKDKIVIGTVLAENLGVKLGDDVKITFRNGVTKQYNVKGILFSGVIDLDRSTILLTYGSLKDALNLSDQATKVVMRVKPGYDAESYKNVIFQLNLNGKVSSGKEEAKAFRSAVAVITFTFRAVNFIALLVGAIMVGIILYISVVESTRQIGILRAIGMQSSSVASIFIMQALFYSIFGGILGIIFGLAYSVYSTAYPIIIPVANTTVYSQFSSFVAMRGFFLTILVSFFAALYPAYKAATTNIIEAIRHE